MKKLAVGKIIDGYIGFNHLLNKHKLPFTAALHVRALLPILEEKVNAYEKTRLDLIKGMSSEPEEQKKITEELRKLLSEEFEIEFKPLSVKLFEAVDVIPVAINGADYSPVSLIFDFLDETTA